MPDRSLAPLPHPPPDAPRLPEQPCSACGKGLDPLRAGEVLAFEDGLRFFCDTACRDDYRGGKRHRHRRTPARTDPDLVDAETLRSLRDQERPEAPAPPRLSNSSIAGAALVLLALLFALFPGSGSARWVSAGASCLAAALALAASAPTRAVVGVLGWAAGPAGAVVAAIAGQAQASLHPSPWPLVGAALAALAMTARAFFDADALVPVERAVRSLSRGLPAHARVPIAADEDPFSLAMRHVQVQSLRTGEEVVAMAGEVLPVDGIVQFGDAVVLPHPGAAVSVRRRPGDPLLAGARVVKGAVRVLASRVGDNRALVRITRFGDGSPQEPSGAGRVANLLQRWGGAATVALAVTIALLPNPGGTLGSLAAAAAVLVSAPLLALRRAISAPLRAAAAHAGARGIVYRSAAALEQAGGVTTVAMPPHRTLTEGRPEVVEVHMTGEGSAEALIGLVHAAELAAAEHPIARAIAQHARDSKVPTREVRRATHVPGRGVTATTEDNEAVVIGNRRFLLDEGISIAVADAEAARAETGGRTPIFVSVGGRIRAVITLQDHLRVGARAAVQRLFDLDLEVVLLTGDQRGPIEQLAAGLDIAHVKAELLPRERGLEVKRLREAGGRVAVIGYPESDEDALGAAEVGIVLAAAGGAGGERAIALVSEDLRDAAAALWIAHAARRRTLRAVRLAVAVFALVVAASIAGLMIPAIAALLAVAVDGIGVRAGAQLLRRLALRLPAPTAGQ